MTSTTVTSTAAKTAAPINDKREIAGWTMYDWANSAFSTTVATVFLGPYVTGLANSVAVTNPDTGSKLVYLLGIPIAPASFIPYCVSLSVLLQVLVLPLLGAISDYSNLRKTIFVFCATLGALATVAMFFVTAPVWWLGGLLFIIANLAFGAALVCYNAYLPDIASEDQRDKVSSQGFALGYLGGGVLLLLNLILLAAGEQIGIDRAMAARLSLASAGVWWPLFAQITFKRLRAGAPRVALPKGESYLGIGFKQLRNTLTHMKLFPHTLAFLVAYLFYNDGVQTVINVSSTFGSEELKLDLTNLSLLVLVIQFVAFGGSFLFFWIARRSSTKRAIIITLVIWSLLVVYAFGFLYTGSQYWLMGIVLALVLGGSQALSRSLYAQMIPADREAEFFSFYEISERGTSWFGPLLFGLVNQISGSMRLGLLSLIVFFIVGLILLIRTDVNKAIREARSAEGHAAKEV